MKSPVLSTEPSCAHIRIRPAARRPKKNAIGRSRGGPSTKVHALVDTTGKPTRVIITQGQQHDSTVAEELIDFITGKACIADRAYDADRILAELKNRGLQAVIPPGPTRKTKRRYDKDLYSIRYRVECFFHDIKRFRRIATRYEKTIECFSGFLYLACAFQWLT